MQALVAGLLERLQQTQFVTGRASPCGDASTAMRSSWRRTAGCRRHRPGRARARRLLWTSIRSSRRHTRRSMRLLGGRHPGVSRRTSLTLSTATATSPRVEGSDVRVHLDVEQVGRPRSGRRGARSCLRGPLRRAGRHRGFGRELVALARDEVRDVGIEAWPRASPAFTAGRSGCRSTFSATRTGWTGSTLLSPIFVLPGRRIGAWAFRTASTPARWPRARSRCRSRSPRMTRETSEQFFSEARELMPGGVSSPVQAFGAVGGSPVFVERGEGAYLVDVDGNRYVDYVLSWGPLVLGHAHPRVVAALEERFAAARATARRARSRSSSRA